MDEDLKALSRDGLVEQPLDQQAARTPRTREEFQG
jgi:hypothetical protein